ncbi:outer membrane lipoprotein chaperone LolA [Herbaspirillum chlorophenolicum]|uniref:Outer-membrane lipoprotein carrier protein n=1 Tax=Herbaspirillum chlorophenolicum TaxID=211589 RepID=A0ABW8EXC7_9BURK
MNNPRHPLFEGIERRGRVQSRARAINLRRILAAVSLSALAVAGAIVFTALTPGRASAAALEQFKQFVASTQSAKGDFTQRLVRNDNGNAKVVNTSSGTFVFSRPGKFIWTYQKPYEQVIQADGEKLFIYDKDLNQVTTKKLGNALGSSPAAILFGSNDLEKNFTLKEAGAKDGMEWLEAVPKSRDTTFDRIGIGFKNGMPVAMELHDSFGQISVLSFDSFEKNPPLKVNSFTFTIPKGADVFSN